MVRFGVPKKAYLGPRNEEWLAEPATEHALIVALRPSVSCFFSALSVRCWWRVGHEVSLSSHFRTENISGQALLSGSERKKKKKGKFLLFVGESQCCIQNSVPVMSWGEPVLYTERRSCNEVGLQRTRGIFTGTFVFEGRPRKTECSLQFHQRSSYCSNG